MKRSIQVPLFSAVILLLIILAVTGFSAYSPAPPAAASAQSSGNKPDETTAAGLQAEKPSPVSVERSIADKKNDPLAIRESTGEGREQGSTDDAGSPISLASARTSNISGNTGNGTQVMATLAPGSGGDIVISQPTSVGAGTYQYGYINITNGGSLVFQDANIDFWTKSILVENGGSLIVGDSNAPVGTLNSTNTVTFHLYGGQGDPGIGCYQDNCGVPASTWTSNGQTKVTLPGQSTQDYFYAYQKLPGDTAYEGITSGTNQRSASECYFGRKVIAVSYGGSLSMYGKTGQTASWVRLAQSVKAGDKELHLARPVDWRKGDSVVVTTTDFLPGHSELHEIDTITSSNLITLKDTITYAHNGAQYKIPQDAFTAVDLKSKTVETRAAVALLSRNVRIVSEGPSLDTGLPAANDPSDERYFGGHTVARQGFKFFDMKGVELYQMGQGGRMAHTPVNFYLTRTTPPKSNVENCSIWDSMNRWIELRGTRGVALQGNVGYLSIGHGYSLADGTETHNALVANIGIYARPAVAFDDNPRTVPGILAKADSSFYNGAGDLRRGQYLGFGGDYIHPSVFFIMNGFNQFEDNMAVGAGTCGSCYWIAPAKVSGPSKNQSWEGYAGIQKNTPGTAPIQQFEGNFCSTAQQSLITIGTTGTCKGLNTPDLATDKFAFTAITNPFDVEYARSDESEGGAHQLYPDISSGGLLQSMSCDETANPDCSKSKACTKGQTKDCVVNVIDSYTSSFHWAQQNFSAIWLREKNFLFTDGALTDVLNGGLTMVSGGSWDQVLNKYWGLTRKTVFIGTTQPNNPYASNMGPVNPNSDLQCDMRAPASYCRLKTDSSPANNPILIEGINIPLDNFGVNQRLYNIYDGPVYQESNAYLDIFKTDVTRQCDQAGNCNGDKSQKFLYSRIPGIPHDTDPGTGTYKLNCIQPNAAIGWKQPNGFYYPPAFHSNNLFFKNVDIRHYVIVPLFNPGTNQVDTGRVKKQYCSYPGIPSTLFSNSFTDVDRQTELNDEDGSLSGLKGAIPAQFPDEEESTVSVNTDSFFYAPVQVLECVSELACIQSPYDYMSAVVFPECAAQGGGGCQDWDADATSRSTYGVPIYRQYLMEKETGDASQSIRMLGASIYQRSTLIANKGKYYIDTTVSLGTQQKTAPLVNVFKPAGTYNFFFLYAKPKSSVTYQLYVGTGLDSKTFLGNNVKMTRAGSTMPDGVVLVTPLEFDNTGAWPAKWSRSYDSTSGILTVSLDFSAFESDFDNANAETCGPASYCNWKNGKCVDKNGSDSICKWAVKSFECPSGGCLGFQVTLPGSFVADDDPGPGHHRPVPQTFTKDFNVDWVKASPDVAGPGACSEPQQQYDPFK